MKVKVKASVVLNPRETDILANVLTRIVTKGTAVAQVSDAQREEERAVVTEFLAKRDAIQQIRF